MRDSVFGARCVCRKPTYMLLYVSCAAVYVSAYWSEFSHKSDGSRRARGFTTYVSSCSYICVSLVLVYMCPHTEANSLTNPTALGAGTQYLARDVMHRLLALTQGTVFFCFLGQEISLAW
jgi:hypothetical protein